MLRITSSLGSYFWSLTLLLPGTEVLVLTPPCHLSLESSHVGASYKRKNEANPGRGEFGSRFWSGI